MKHRWLWTAPALFIIAAGCGSNERDKDPVEPEAKKPTVDKKESSEAAAGGMHEDWKDVPLERASAKGLDWLVSVQGGDGGWGQDGGHKGDARKGVRLESSGNDVANTAMVCLAFLRAGTTPTGGRYRESLQKAIQFILAHIEEAPSKGLSITKRKRTQIQRKLGPYIDTFLAAVLLAEIDSTTGAPDLQKRVRKALEKCVSKIEKNQKRDGSWNIGGGWASIFCTSFASRGLYQAEVKGVRVSNLALKRVSEYTSKNFDRSSGGFLSKDGAGVELYSAGQFMEENSRNPQDRTTNAVQLKAATRKLSSGAFLKGYGSMGGEEFVSYFNISDSMIRIGGKDWKKWNGKIKTHILKLQNKDGTWAGHHCITGRVACTSAAVLTLLTERTAAREE